VSTDYRAGRNRGVVEGMHIGLRLVREQKRWTQKTTAQAVTETARRMTGNTAVKVSVSLIAMIESQERNPSLEVAEWIAETFNRRVDELCIVRPAAAAA
jgi:transcriptional regulator with XRE-family HTH domain